MKYLTKRDPFDVFDVFDRVLQPVNFNNQMKTDVSETDKNYLFTVDLPGFNKEDINISVDKGYLTIAANKEEEKEENDKGYIFRERKIGNCSRSFYLGDVSEDKISAKYENGTLVIDIPKQEKIETTKKIQIN
ncbi:MAG TPA: Hsp20/alpha crystallin family protein [Eubacteriales bacterium]|nr:Hsp20/alpha crystallin family protein [Eubacteriales bacterium]